MTAVLVVAMASEIAGGLVDVVEVVDASALRVAAPASASARLRAVLSGVGKVNAAAATAYALARLSPSAVVNLGYCASLDARYPRGSVALPARTVQHDYGHYEAGAHTLVRGGRPTLEGRSSPEGERYFESDGPLRRALAEALATSPDVGPSFDRDADPTLATGDLFVVDGARSASIRRATGGHLLDMEAAAIAQVCAAAAIPFATVKVVSDDAGAEGIANYVSALEALRGGLFAVTACVARALRDLPAEGGPGKVAP